MSIPFVPTCPEGCETTPPPVAFDFCTPVYSFGEIKYLFLQGTENDPFDDWTSGAEWLGKIENEDETGDEIRQLTIIGSKPEPEMTEVEMSLNRKIYPPKTHTIDFKIDEVNDTNYAFLRSLECGGTFRTWYGTDDFIWGGPTGIEAQVVLWEVIPEDDNELYHFAGRVTWKSKFSPERAANPLT